MYKTLYIITLDKFTSQEWFDVFIGQGGDRKPPQVPAPLTLLGIGCNIQSSCGWEWQRWEETNFTTAGWRDWWCDLPHTHCVISWCNTGTSLCKTLNCTSFIYIWVSLLCPALVVTSVFSGLQTRYELGPHQHQTNAQLATDQSTLSKKTILGTSIASTGLLCCLSS